MPSRQQPRSRPDYDWTIDGSTSRQGRGIYILKPGISAIVRKPSWFGTETIFRPYPCVSFANPLTEFEPYRLIDNNNKFSDFIRHYACAWQVGSGRTCTYLVKKTTKVYDPWSGPLGILWTAIENACKKSHPMTAEWQPLRESGFNKGRPLKGPSECFLMQGALIRHDKNEFLGKNGPPLGWGKNMTCIMLLSMDAGNNLVDLLGKEKEGYTGSPDDFEARHVNGDPISPLFGRFVHLWERGTDPRGRYNSQPTPQSGGWDQLGDGGVATGGKHSKSLEAKGFDIELTTAYGSMPASLNKAGEQQIRDHWQDWDDILYFPSEVEQAHMLSECFPPSAIKYAFEGQNAEWISDEVKQRLTNATSTVGHGPYKEPPPPSAAPQGYDPNDGWGATPVAAQQQQQQVAAPAPGGAGWGDAPVDAVQRSFGEDQPWHDASQTVEDSTVPQQPIDNPLGAKTTSGVDLPGTVAPPVSERAPQTPTPPAPTTQVQERTELTIAKLAAARGKIK